MPRLNQHAGQSVVFKKGHSLRAGGKDVGLVAQHSETQPEQIGTQGREAARRGHIQGLGQRVGQTHARIQQAAHLSRPVYIVVIFGKGIEGHIHMTGKDVDALAAAWAGGGEEHAHRGVFGAFCDGPDRGLGAGHGPHINREQQQPDQKQNRTPGLDAAYARLALFRLAEGQIRQGKEHGRHQAAHTGRGQGHEQQEADIAQQGQAGQKASRRGGSQQGQQAQRRKASCAQPPERNAAHREVLIQQAAGRRAEVDGIAEGAPDAESRCQ